MRGELLIHMYNVLYSVYVEREREGGTEGKQEEGKERVGEGEREWERERGREGRRGREGGKSRG